MDFFDPLAPQHWTSGSKVEILGAPRKGQEMDCNMNTGELSIQSSCPTWGLTLVLKIIQSGKWGEVSIHRDTGHQHDLNCSKHM